MPLHSIPSHLVSKAWGPLQLHGGKAELSTEKRLYRNKPCPSAKCSQVLGEAHRKRSEMQESFTNGVELNAPNAKVLMIPSVSAQIELSGRDMFTVGWRGESMPSDSDRNVAFPHDHCQHKARKSCLRFADENTAELTSGRRLCQPLPPGSHAALPRNHGKGT